MSDKTDKPWPGPPGGVSTTDGQGGHTPINDPAAKPPARSSGRRRQVGEDILKNIDSMPEVSGDDGYTPAGVRGVKKDIRLGKMPKTRRSRRHHASFTSIDGQEYVFRTHDTKGKQFAYLPTQVLYMCLRELSLGGSALPILRAFNVNFNDEDGKQFLPVSEEILHSIGDDGVEEEQPEFSLGTNE